MSTDDGEGPTFSMVLWQLQQYQMVVREWQPFLSSNEFMVVMQLLDRTIGWQRESATIRSQTILKGDRKYGGLGSAMHRSTMMKVLACLQRRGILLREWDEDRRWLRAYTLNLDWHPSPDHEAVSSGDPVSERDGVSHEDNGVSYSDHGVSDGAEAVSDEDPREEYRDNYIGEANIDNSHPARPVPDARWSIQKENKETGSLRSPVIIPSPRARRRPPL